METKKLKKVLTKGITDKSTGQVIIVKQQVLLMCRESGDPDEVSCSVCPYSGLSCETIPDPRETGNLDSSFSDYCDSLHQEDYYKDGCIHVTLDMIPTEGSLEESFAKFPRVLGKLKGRKGNKKVS